MEDLTASKKNLDANAVLGQLKERLKNDKIYTYAGETLIKLLPAREIKIHSKAVSDSYHLSKWREKPAHLFAVADDAYQGILGKRGSQAENQRIILRGVSGSGKTEAVKRLIRHLVLTSCDTQLQHKILLAPLILEAFGNARTTLNANASRFGLYTTLYFSQGKVVGMKVSEYFLEKWRVSNQAEDESNFHVFYYVMAGQGLNQKSNEQRYLQNNQVLNSTNMSALQDKCHAVINAMTTIGFSQKEQADINVILFAILSLGNITIQKSRVGEASLDSEAIQTLQNMADLLGLNAADLEESLCCGDIIVNGEKVQKRLSRDEAEDNRDSLARLIYQRLFAWIIYRLNILLVPDSGTTPEHEIGILDMPGFENFAQNSLEQCYVDFTDELLHGFYVKHMFRVTEEECRNENVTWVGIDVPNNYDTVDLFLAKPSGLFATLEEVTQKAKGSDEDLANQLAKNLQKSPYFQAGPTAMNHLFTVTHYIDKVTYDSRGWLAKNQNAFSSSAVLMLQNAENDVLGTLFKSSISSRGTMVFYRRGSSTKKDPIPNSRNLTTTTHYKNSIQSLLDRLGKIKPHFICCIRPNKTSKGPAFDDQYVLHQLSSLGVLQAAQMYVSGFAISVDHAEFAEIYKGIVSNPKTSTPAETCRSILNNCKIPAGWQIGTSKVFLKSCHLRSLAELLSQQENAVLESVYSLAQPISPLYAQVAPKSLRGSVKASAASSLTTPVGGRLYPLLNDVEANADSDSSDSDFEVLEEKFLNQRRQEIQSTLYGEVGSRQATVKWFLATQAKFLRQENNSRIFEEWCHGIITRKEAEDLLKQQPVGCFLVRLGETRLGYTLSFKDSNRCRHYMIDQLMNGNFKVTGENREHKSLRDLVNFYKKNKLANWSGVLATACGQRDGHCDYLELVISREEEEQLTRLMNMARLEPSAPLYEPRAAGSQTFLQSPPRASRSGNQNQGTRTASRSPQPDRKGSQTVRPK